MKTVESINEQYQNKLSEILKECLVFFAFSKQQFEENKTPLEEGEKYVPLCGGGYCPRSKVESFLQKLKELETWRRSEIRKAKLQDAEIAYELNNHECYYTGDISTVVELFKGRYPEVRIRNIYIKTRKKQNSQ